MIDEAIGKILGMAMAYGASALGMFVAYVNYRRRVVRADKVMTPAAWAVIVISTLAVGGAAAVVVHLATAPDAATEIAAPGERASESPSPAAAGPPAAATEAGAARNRWPWIGVVVPAGIFLFATFITAALHRHFAPRGA